MLWQIVNHLETNGLVVISVTADGSSVNRKMFQMHGDGLVYKTRNVYGASTDFFFTQTLLIC